MVASQFGIMPRDFWAMSLWEFGAVVAGRIDERAETLRDPDELIDELDKIAVRVRQ